MDYRGKIKEDEKIEKYLDLARELKKTQWNIRVKVIPILVVVLGTDTRRLERQEELKTKERIETIQTTALLKLAYWDEFLRPDWFGLVWFLCLMAYQPL